jgi:hypothetical protein
MQGFDQLRFAAACARWPVLYERLESGGVLGAGVEVDLGSVAYHSSQPWPFPQSLMLGFTAAAAAAISTPIGLDALEVTFSEVHTCSCEWLCKQRRCETSLYVTWIQTCWK